MTGKKFGRASVGLFVATMVTNVSMLLYHRTLSSSLLSDYAQLTALMAVVNVLGNVTLGLNTYLVKAFSADAEIKGPGAVKGRLLLLLGPGLLTLGMMVAALALASPFVKSYLKLPTAGLALMVDLIFATGVLLVVLRSAQQGLHHFGYLGLSVAGEGLARTSVVAPALNGSVAGGLGALLIGQTAGIACALAGLMGLGPSKPPMKAPKGEHGLAHALREGGADTLALTLLAMVAYLDVLVLKHYYTDDQAGLYSRAALVAKSFLYLPTALNMILLAAAARELAGGRDPRRLLERFLGAALVLDVIGLLVVWFATPFCLAVLAGGKPEFRTPDMLTLTRWFSLAVVPLGLLQMVVAYLLAIRRRGVAWMMAALALVYLGALHFLGGMGYSLENELSVVGALGVCSALALAGTLWSALTKPPRRDEWSHE